MKYVAIIDVAWQYAIGTNSERAAKAIALGMWRGMPGWHRVALWRTDSSGVSSLVAYHWMGEEWR